MKGKKTIEVMNKYDWTLEWTQFSFKISFLKVFTLSYHCRAQYSTL